MDKQVDEPHKNLTSSYKLASALLMLCGNQSCWMGLSRHSSRRRVIHHNDSLDYGEPLLLSDYYWSTRRSFRVQPLPFSCFNFSAPYEKRDNLSFRGKVSTITIMSHRSCPSYQLQLISTATRINYNANITPQSSRNQTPMTWP